MHDSCRILISGDVFGTSPSSQHILRLTTTAADARTRAYSPCSLCRRRAGRRDHRHGASSGWERRSSESQPQPCAHPSDHKPREWRARGRRIQRQNLSLSRFHRKSRNQKHLANRDMCTRACAWEKSGVPWKSNHFCSAPFGAFENTSARNGLPRLFKSGSSFLVTWWFAGRTSQLSGFR